jgi:hypothetical protein
MWWDILKNANLSSKGKGSTLDTSKIKVNVKQLEEEDGPCKKRLRELILKAVPFPSMKGQVGIGPAFPRLPEEAACHILKLIEKYDQDIDAFVEDTRRGEDKWDEWLLPDNGPRYEIQIFYGFFEQLSSARKEAKQPDKLGKYYITVFDHEVVEYDEVIDLMLNYRDYKKWSEYI